MQRHLSTISCTRSWPLSGSGPCRWEKTWWVVGFAPAQSRERSLGLGLQVFLSASPGSHKCSCTDLCQILGASQACFRRVQYSPCSAAAGLCGDVSSLDKSSRVNLLRLMFSRQKFYFGVETFSSARSSLNQNEAQLWSCRNQKIAPARKKWGRLLRGWA